MKRKMLEIGALFLALQILFVSLGMNVNFHYCSEDHHLMGSFGDASELCEHCLHHHHHAHMNEQEFEEHLAVVHFGAKCCCEDFNSEIGFADQYTFSTEKPLMVFLPFSVLTEAFHVVLNDNLAHVFRCFPREIIPYLFTGRLKTIFFSSLKLNPLVF